MLIDTHCHLEMIQEKAKLTDLAQLLEFCTPLPERMVHVACHPDVFEQAVAFMEDPRIFATFGVHPHEASLYTPAVEADLLRHLKHPKAVALGEIGLDYHYDMSPREIQRTVFQRQLALALELNKPVVLHTRDAEEDTLQILSEAPLAGHKIHVHCYTGPLPFAEKLLALPAEIYFGFTGILTFKNADEIRAVAAAIPQNRILTETDSPFLAPIPFRGKTAHPGMIGIVLEAFAKVRGMSVQELEPVCRENARAFYGV